MNSIRSFTQELVELVSQMPLDPKYRADFDSQAWVQQWINSPVPALGFKKPIEFFSTVEGQETVKQLLRAMEQGVYM